MSKALPSRDLAKKMILNSRKGAGASTSTSTSNSPTRHKLREARKPSESTIGTPVATILPEANVVPTTSHNAPRATSPRKGGKAISIASTNARTPSQDHDIPQATSTTPPMKIAPAEPHSVGQSIAVTQSGTADRTELPGHHSDETQSAVARQPDTDCGHVVLANHTGAAAVGEPDAHQGQASTENQVRNALVGEIRAIYRRYEDLRRARQRIELQAIATCRNVCGGDKTEGMKLYKSPSPQVAVWLQPYELAMAPLTEAIKEHEKLLTKFGKQLPVREWMDTVTGLSPRFLAAIVGECGIGPGEFRSVSALWKRMGMAVINGERQRRVTGDAAIEHGYVARRRALMWNIGDQVAVRQGIRNPKDEEGKSTGATAINEWGALYLERKAYLTAKNENGDYALRKGVVDGKMTPMHIHNDAKRYVEKRLLRELWKAWRRATMSLETSPEMPADEFVAPTQAAA